MTKRTFAHTGMMSVDGGEAGFQRRVIDYALLRGWLCYHSRPVRVRRASGAEYWTTPMTGSPGFPDLVFARNGVVFFAELKDAKGKLSAAQLAWQDAINGEGSGRAIVWRPQDFNDIMRILE